MKLQFRKLIIHNFLSYGHSEISLDDNGYCLVSGINNNPKDNALSNGSGKSSWASAICWCLTGSTVQGLSSNIKNIFVEENSCYVTLDFLVDGVSYLLTRYKEPKSDLKIIINGEDKSGKGIRESENILAQYLPDLTNNLIASIIILGQGLPCKFTSNSPSGRKEVLEKLSKSDFMIQDIKNKISKRDDFLKSNLRVVQDKILSSESKKSILEEQKEKINNQILELDKPQDFDSQISYLEEEIEKSNVLISDIKIKLDNYTLQSKSINEKLSKILEEKNNKILFINNTFNSVKQDYIVDKNNLTIKFNSDYSEETNSYNLNVGEINLEYSEKLNTLKNKINNLKAEIEKLQNIKDICPTCGQKLPNVLKPDTSEMEKELETLIEENKLLNIEFTSKKEICVKLYNNKVNDLKVKYNEDVLNLDNEFKKKEIIHNDYLTECEDSYSEEISNIKFEIKKVKDNIDMYSSALRQNENKNIDLIKALNKIKLDKDNYETRLNTLKSEFKSILDSIDSFTKDIEGNAKIEANLSDKLAIISKINTLIKRDFRGFLLSNIINFINKKSKEYSKDIFGNSDLEFTLNGNNVDITYCGKAFENLSGGEKQKVDLIIQFAIRDMMSSYLDFSSNILVLDEIFDALDSIGVTNVLNLISNKLLDIDSMFIISHRASELEIPYDHEFIVTKSDKGISSIKQI